MTRVCYKRHAEGAWKLASDGGRLTFKNNITDMYGVVQNPSLTLVHLKARIRNGNVKAGEPFRVARLMIIAPLRFINQSSHLRT
jgi:hypothetical protein